MNLSSEQLMILADSLGEIARGCKKIRGVLLGLVSTTPIIVQPENQETDPGEGEPSDISEESDNISDEDFCETALQYMCTKKMKWSPVGAKRYFTDMVRSRLRANTMNFCWIHTGGNLESRRNWKKISRRKIEKIYSDIYHGWQEILDFIGDQDTCPKGIRPSKWSRRKMVVDCTFPETLFEKKGFKTVLLDNHDDLGALK